jgi:oxygen-dependent protoporphyrinogen oxidase
MTVSAQHRGTASLAGGSAREGSARLAIVGTGAAGLAAAFRLQQAGFRVTLFEREDRPGGRMRTLHRDGFLIEEGATQLVRGYRSFMGVINDAGLVGQLVPASSTIGMIDPSGTTHVFEIEHIQRELARTRLISARAKLALSKVVLDVVRHRRHMDVTDLSKLARVDHLSAERYARQRWGQELLDCFVDPVVRGFVGTDPANVSAACMLYAFGLFMSKQRFVALKEGMSSYADLLSRNFDVTLRAEVTGVDRRGDEAQVIWRDAKGTEHAETFQGVVIAVPPRQAATIYTGLGSWRREFLTTKISHAANVALHVALDRVPSLTASMVYAPAHSGEEAVLAASLEHNKVPHRIPPGKALVSVYASADWSRQLIDQDSDTITGKLLEAGTALVPGIDDAIRFTHVTRWPYSWMQSWPGFWTAMREFTARCREQDSIVQLAGDYFCTSNINTASASGERAARDLAVALRTSRSRGSAAEKAGRPTVIEAEGQPPRGRHA